MVIDAIILQDVVLVMVVAVGELLVLMVVVEVHGMVGVVVGLLMVKVGVVVETGVMVVVEVHVVVERLVVLVLVEVDVVVGRLVVEEEADMVEEEPRCTWTFRCKCSTKSWCSQ